MLLPATLKLIGDLHLTSMEKARVRLDSLTNPIGSLGRLEDIVKQLAGITGAVFPKVDNKAVVTMCADNGVVAEGVSSCPKSVTSSVTMNFMRGITGINVLAKHADSRIVVVDVGVDADLDCPGIIDRKVRKGTDNMATGPAMTREEAVKCLETGIEIVNELKTKGINLLGTGEMGIGNTSTSSAIAAVLTDSGVEALVGKGAGMTKDGLENKVRVIKRAIKINSPDKNDPIDVLAKVGGFDIAGLAGCFIGAAANRIPIVIDGFISSVAALAAVRIKPEVRKFLLPSHGSAEPGSAKVLEALGLEPMLNLGMRLGEGTGAALAFHIIDAAISAYENMGTFGDANIEQYVSLE